MQKLVKKFVITDLIIRYGIGKLLLQKFVRWFVKKCHTLFKGAEKFSRPLAFRAYVKNVTDIEKK